MDSGFISVTQKLVSEQGKNALLELAKCKAHLSDYAKGEFKKERHLLMVAIEAGAAKEIANASDLETCKKIQARFLKDERFIDETAACEIVDLLAFVLRGDNSQSIATPPSSQYASPSTSQSQYASQQSAYPQYAPPQQQSYRQSGYQYPPNAPYPPQSQQIKYIGFWARLTANIIDNVLLLAILFALFFIMGAMGFFNSMSDSDFDAPPFQAFANIAGMVVAFIYAIAFWATKQATPGKMIFGAKIVDAKTLGKPSGGQLAGRYFAYIISAIPLCLGFLWVAFDSQKRGWHDMLAGTLVIDKNIYQYSQQQPPYYMPPQTSGAATFFKIVAILFVVVIGVGILAAVALPRFAGIQDDAMISSEKAGIGAVRSSLQAIRGRGLARAKEGVELSIYDEEGSQYKVAIRPYSASDPNNERRFSASYFANALSLRSWNNPILSRDPNYYDSARGPTALALVLEPGLRDGWKTKAFDDYRTEITGAATNSVFGREYELNTNKFWLYDPKDGTIKLYLRD